MLFTFPEQAQSIISSQYLSFLICRHISYIIPQISTAWLKSSYESRNVTYLITQNHNDEDEHNLAPIVQAW